MKNELRPLPAKRLATLLGSVILLAALNTGPASAQTGAADIRRCLQISDDAARIRCYDNVARALSGNAPLPTLAPQPQVQTSPLVTTQPIAQSPSANDDRVVTFGLPPARVEGEDYDAILYDRIADLEKNGFGDYLVTLVSGQVWKQTSAQEYRLREGQEVTIRPTSWGSDFRLHGDGTPGHIQVTRVK